MLCDNDFARRINCAHYCMHLFDKNKVAFHLGKRVSLRFILSGANR